MALYLFYELLTLTTYPLVIQERSPEAMQAGTKYLLYNLSGAAVLLLAIVLTAAWGGRLDFVGGPILAGGLKTGLNWLLFLFTVGFGGSRRRSCRYTAGYQRRWSRRLQ